MAKAPHILRHKQALIAGRIQEFADIKGRIAAGKRQDISRLSWPKSCWRKSGRTTQVSSGILQLCRAGQELPAGHDVEFEKRAKVHFGPVSFAGCLALMLSRLYPDHQIGALWDGIDIGNPGFRR
jgi:hypothetical protein